MLVMGQLQSGLGQTAVKFRRPIELNLERCLIGALIMLRYFTAGESHGETLVAFLSGLPAGLAVDQAFLDRELWRRQQGFGRGGRMKIETDKAHIVSGVRHGKTIGSPISILLENKDWKNWQESLPVEAGDPEKHKRVASPRPGHADLGRRSEIQLSRSPIHSRTRLRPRIRGACRHWRPGQTVFCASLALKC